MKASIKKRRRALDRRRGVLTLDGGLPFSQDSVGYNMGAAGQCYMASYRILCDMTLGGGVDRSCVRIAQGVVMCRYEPSEWCNKRVMHAWVEWRINGFDIALDGSRPGHPVAILPLETYLEVGEIETDKVWRYDMREACEMAAWLEHYGPWKKPMVPSDDWTEEDEAKVDHNGFYVDP